jgi:hypothetical protein
VLQLPNHGVVVPQAPSRPGGTLMAVGVGEARAGTEGAFTPDGAATPETAALAGDDPEMLAIRAFAAEVVRAAGGVPSGGGYRLRLEPARRRTTGAGLPVSSAVVPRTAFWTGWQPRRALTFALAGVGAIGAVFFLLRWALLPNQAALELPGARPIPIAVAPTPVPPVPAMTEAPASHPAAPALPAEKPVAARLPERPVAALPAKRQAPAPDVAPGRRAGRRMETTLASGGRGKTEKTIPSTARTKPQRVAAALDQRAIIAGMEPIQPLVKQCYRRYGQQGVANVAVEVGRGGKVKRVTVSGPLARTRSAACVKAAVKTARFSSGDLSFHYPLVLQ